MTVKLRHPLRGSATLLVALLPLWACAHQPQLSPQVAAERARLRAQAQQLATSSPMCVLLGPSGEHPGVYGTDLGFTVEATDDKSKQWVLFGDTWGEAGDACRYAPEEADDLLASLPLQRPTSLPASPERMRPCEVIRYELGSDDDLRTWSRCRLYAPPKAGSSVGMPLSMGFLRTPVAAFRSADSVFGLFHRSEPVKCKQSDDCPYSMRCSKELQGVKVGMCHLPALAPDGGAGNFCRNDDDCMLGECALDEAGYCMSRVPFKVEAKEGVFGPNWYREDPRRALAKLLKIGRMEGPRPGDFSVVAEFPTNRFLNAVARGVAHFDPDHPERNDYRPGEHTLLMWGRSAFFGERGAQSLPFLLYNRLPKPGAALEWKPRFFAGLSTDGRPTWSADEEDAQPLYGGKPEIIRRAGEVRFDWPAPEFDHVNQMAVTWLAGAKRWIMLYGGDMPDFMITDEDGDRLPATYPQPIPGAIHLRAARHPWGDGDSEGAWSPPLPLLTPEQAASYLACPDSGSDDLPGCQLSGDPHGPFTLFGTLLQHAATLKPGPFFEVAGQCLAGDVATDILYDLSGDHVGRLYGVNIIDAWTEAAPADKGAIDLYWNVSTWNPYQVILVRSRLHPAQLAHRDRQSAAPTPDRAP